MREPTRSRALEQSSRGRVAQEPTVACGGAHLAEVGSTGARRLSLVVARN